MKLAVKKRTGSLVFLLSMALSGCVVSPVFYQPGIAATAQDSTILYVSNDGSIIVKDLDGKELADPLTTWNGGYAAVREIHMAPGQHTIIGQAKRANGYQWYQFTHEFKASTQYRLVATLTGYRITVVPVEMGPISGTSQ